MARADFDMLWPMCLAVVVEKHALLIFRAWRSGDWLEYGVWNIPVPAEGPAVQPDTVIAPIVGFDCSYCRNCRLRYGGRFFYRTLAAMTVTSNNIGVGYVQAPISII